MRQDAIRAPNPLPPLLRELAEHLQLHGSNLSTDEAGLTAIRTWIDARQASALPEPPGPGFGYQWKELFLPDGTELRMSTCGNTFHARVIDDRIDYQGRSVSPRGLTLAIAGEGRNAWRDLWLKLPGERYWKQAQRCRSEQRRALVQQALSPSDSVAAAAKAMSEALKNALLLVEHANAIAARKVERPQRRGTDVLGQDCPFG